MKTTLLSCSVAPAVRERRISPAVLPMHGTGLSVAGNRTAVSGVSLFAADATARPGPARGAPV